MIRDIKYETFKKRQFKFASNRNETPGLQVSNLMLYPLSQSTVPLKKLIPEMYQVATDEFYLLYHFP